MRPDAIQFSEMTKGRNIELRLARVAGAPCYVVRLFPFETDLVRCYYAFLEQEPELFEQFLNCYFTDRPERQARFMELRHYFFAYRTLESISGTLRDYRRSRNADSAEGHASLETTKKRSHALMEVLSQ